MHKQQNLEKLILKLSIAQSSVCLSIYTPLDYNSPDALTANKIRIKNIIGEIKKLNENNNAFKVKDIDKLVQPLQQLLDSRDALWQRDAKSLAVFASQDSVEYQFLPIEQDDQHIVVSNSFLIEPLRKLVKGNKSFYVLSASHDKVELYYGDKFHLEPVPLETLPQSSAEETLGIDEFPNSLQYHPATTPSAKAGRGKFTKQFHGQYNVVEVDRNIMKKYFRAVNNVVYNYLRGTQRPLVFAGVNYLFPLYEQVNSYKHLIKRPVEGNFQHGNTDELHARALSLI